MIKRYDVFIDYHKGEVAEVTIEPKPDGEWVKYEDYQKEVDDLRLINDKLLALNKEYKKL